MRKILMLISTLLIADGSIHAVELEKAVSLEQGTSYQSKHKVTSDKEYAYILTRGRVYKSDLRDLQKATLLSALEGLDDSLLDIAYHQGRLWVLKEARDLSTESMNLLKKVHHLVETQIIYSDDSGKTFQAVPLPQFRRNLKTPFGNFPEFARIDQISFETIAGKSAIVINAGVGWNLWASFDQAKTWKSLIKSIKKWETVGYTGFFKIDGDNVFFGGEHPMDDAYLKYGKFDSKGMINVLKDVNTPDLQNQKIYVIETNGKNMYAGSEAGILVSSDAGLTWRYTFKETTKPWTPERDPNRIGAYYINILKPEPKGPGLVLAGGQPKSGPGSLLQSQDFGKTWTDFSTEVVADYEFLTMSRLPDGKVILMLGDRIEDNNEGLNPEDPSIENLVKDTSDTPMLVHVFIADTTK